MQSERVDKESDGRKTKQGSLWCQ